MRTSGGCGRELSGWPATSWRPSISWNSGTSICRCSCSGSRWAARWRFKGGARGLEADGLVLAAPAVWGWQDMNPLYRVALWGAAHAMPASTATGGGLGVQVSDNVEWLRAYGRDPLNIRETRFDALFGLVDLMQQAQEAAPAARLPALFVYGANDEIIPEDPTQRVMASYGGDKRVAIYDLRLAHGAAGPAARAGVARHPYLDDDPSAVLPSGEEVHP
jgi:acylglycerol lipase